MTITIVFYANKSLEAKLIKLYRDPKNKTKERGSLNLAITNANIQKNRALLWPIFLSKNIISYVKNKLKKE